MNGFYVVLIFLGIILVLIALGWVVFDSKRTRDYRNQLDEKQAELIKVINDADQMLVELNKFSDYIVTQIDLKENELSSRLLEFEKRLGSINESLKDNSGDEKKKLSANPGKGKIKESSNPVRPTKKTKEAGLKVVEQTEQPNENAGLPDLKDLIATQASDLIIESEYLKKANEAGTQETDQYAPMSEKVIPLSSKHKEILLLAREGLSDTEIAKRLNIGKGEIQLVLGMNR